MIEVDSVTKRYGGFLAVDHVSFQVRSGEVVGFLGQNGAGKTTTLRMISCFMPPSEGSIAVAGFDTVRAGDAVRSRIGYLPERVPVYDDMRVGEYLRFRARLKGVSARDLTAAVDRVIGRTHLDHKRKNAVGTLSKGLRQRVGIADALVHKPPLLILDEPTSGLDPDQRLEVRKLIRELGAEHTVLLSTHILPEADAICDHVIIIHRGQIRASDRLENLRGAKKTVRLIHKGAPLEHYGSGSLKSSGDPTIVEFSSEEAASAAATAAVLAGRELIELRSEAPTLENIFVAITSDQEVRV